MTAARRVAWNFGLQRAVERAEELGRPIVVLEGLRARYRWASDRFHAFILEGMADNARRLRGSGILYYPYVETKPDEGKGLLAALGACACVVVTDDFPEFFLPRMVASAARQLPVRLEQVDGNGLLPMRLAGRTFPTAFAFRRFLQKELPRHLRQFPEPDPLASVGIRRAPSLPEEIARRWPRAPDGLLQDIVPALGSLPIDHTVGKVAMEGGASAAQVALRRFLDRGLPRYAESRNQPDEEVTSGLSPYLHFGHISPHQVFAELASRFDWSGDCLDPKATGGRQGWWGLPPGAEAFLDQMVTWRELGYNLCATRPDYDRYESLPDWARRTLEAHAGDRRAYVYSRSLLRNAQTHDPLWNAAQRQLTREGIIHNYLRMLWGKKILEWSPSPREALETMIELNNTYALDGRDPNSYSGIFWCLGRYDRPWGPERPVFGTIRYMSSLNTARKVRVEGYIQKYAP
jgi:deoxyribodipyrimidine photo-lyase